VLLERCVWTQPNSRYEVSGEYMMPPGVEPPWGKGDSSTADATAAAPTPAADSNSSPETTAVGVQQAAGGQQKQQQEGQVPEEGRWRVQVRYAGGKMW
jgi:hypothetical protein